MPSWRGKVPHHSPLQPHYIATLLIKRAILEIPTLPRNFERATSRVILTRPSRIERISILYSSRRKETNLLSKREIYIYIYVYRERVLSPRRGSSIRHTAPASAGHNACSAINYNVMALPLPRHSCVQFANPTWPNLPILTARLPPRVRAFEEEKKRSATSR